MRATFLRTLLCLMLATVASGSDARVTRATAPRVVSAPDRIPAHASPARRVAAVVPPHSCGPDVASQPGNSIVEIGTWTKPEPGWLYVLDPKPDVHHAGGCIWLLDPENAKMMGSIRTGDDADFALSPDGSRLYIASDSIGDSSDLTVIDTTQGTIIERGNIDDRAIASVPRPFSTMAVSGDGAVLRVLIQTPHTPNGDSFLLAAFDTAAGDFLPGSVFLGNCGPGRFISYPVADRFDFLCPRTNKVRLIDVDDNSRTLRNSDVEFPWERRIGIAAALEAPGDPNIELVRGDGAVVKMDVGTLGFAGTAASSDLPARIFPAAWPTSPDGNRIYLGYNQNYDKQSNRFYLDYGRPPNIRPTDATAAEFRVFNTHTWQKIGKIKTNMPFWSAVVGTDGKLLYAMAPQKHSILVMDTTTMRETRTISVGGMPSLALVAP